MVGPNTHQFYPDMRDEVAFSLLSRYGFDCAILVKSGEVFDPVQGLVTTPATLVAYPAKGVYGGGFTGKRPGVTIDREGNTLVRKRGKQVYIDASLLTIPVTSDLLFQDETGTNYEIINVEAINPGGVTIMWRITVDK